MWRAAAGQPVSVDVPDGGDDWETDPDFENDVTEKEQRWGAKTVAGSGHQEHINIHTLRENVSTEHSHLKQQELETMPKASHGYGGKFGVQQDRMDKSAVGHEYQSKLSKHCSQTDTSKGFGGKFGVQADRVDQSAVGFEYAGKTEKHASQKDYATGFGGRYGVQADRVDQSAVGFDYQGKTEKHESQKDYAKGFGGKFGVETDKVDKSAVGFEYQGKTEKHESQKDYVKGFGGSLEFRLTGRTNQPWAGTTRRNSSSTSPRKTTPKALVGNLASSRTEWTRVLALLKKLKSQPPPIKKLNLLKQLAAARGASRHALRTSPNRRRRRTASGRRRRGCAARPRRGRSRRRPAGRLRSRPKPGPPPQTPALHWLQSPSSRICPPATSMRTLAPTRPRLRTGPMRTSRSPAALRSRGRSRRRSRSTRTLMRRPPTVQRARPMQSMGKIWG
ncbi:hypothetical protein ANANG_G00211740 [Anguilla anguilla]|uniref:Cortactin n=1 Tax=Anguilla anguilla TaxID=7936 RepID=A0A9D3LZU3_ANGAN|nr:hypothetical protein ANANG_G00211740 [Anguilla anguilla]